MIVKEWKKRDLVDLFFCIVFSIVCIVFFIHRLIRGIDITDETSYAVTAYRLVRGNILFRDVWDVQSSFAVIYAGILYLYMKITGTVDGCILFSRIMFFALNCGVSYFLFRSCKKYFSVGCSILLSVFYLFYAPFSIYAFSYNNMVILLSSLIILLIFQGIISKRSVFFVLGGISGCMLVFIYPTMVFFAPMMIVLLLLRHKKIGRAWLYVMIGGLISAVLIAGILLLTVGWDSFMIWVDSILKDPAYGDKDRIQIILHGIEYIFAPFANTGLWIKLFCVCLFVAGLLSKRFPKLKLIMLIYPVIVLIDRYPFQEKQQAYSVGNYIFYLAFLGPILIAFTEKYRKEFGFLLYYAWLPSFLIYMIVAGSSYGGAGQGTYTLVFAALVTLMEMLLIVQETYGMNTFDQRNGETWLKNALMIGMLCITVVGELWVYRSMVYRDGRIDKLSVKMETGPYKGLYTTDSKHDFLLELESVLNNLEEPGKTEMVLYHCTFAYLYLDMFPTTPTSWGLYPMNGMDNQQIYLDYFGVDSSHLPDYIYIVNVPDDFDYDGQQEEYYTYAERLNAFISMNYELIDNRPLGDGGNVKKLKLAQSYEQAMENMEKVNVSSMFSSGFTELAIDDRVLLQAPKSGELVITNYNGKKKSMQMHMTVKSVNDETITLWLSGGGMQKSYTIDDSDQDIVWEDELEPGDNKLSLIVTTNNVEDTEEIGASYYYIYNYSVELN